jgi:hypothetical protein
MTDLDDLADLIRSRCRFEYLDPQSAVVLYRIPIGQRGWVAVFGEPDCGAYEWIVQDDGEFVDVEDDDLPPLQQSNCGYGHAVTALRDGLVEALDED